MPADTSARYWSGRFVTRPGRRVSCALNKAGVALRVGGPVLALLLCP